MKREDPPIVVEESFDRPIETVWNALTRPDLMRRWYFENIPDFAARVGFETHFDIESGGRRFRHLWRVIEAEPPRRVVYSWAFEGYAGRADSIWELSEQDGGTRLRLTFPVHEDFPDGVPELTREACLGGWRYFVNERLKDYLEAG